MTHTTVALLAKICEEKGIELDAKLKKDVDTVLGLITDELVETGVAARLDAMNMRLTSMSEKYREAINDLAKRIVNANGTMNNLESAVEMQRRSVESLIGKDGRRFMIPERYERAQAARDIYAGMLDDSLRSLDEDNRKDPAIITACIEAASLVAWRFVDGPRAYSPDGTPAPNEYVAPRLKSRIADKQAERRM